MGEESNKLTIFFPIPVVATVPGLNPDGSRIRYINKYVSDATVFHCHPSIGSM